MSLHAVRCRDYGDPGEERPNGEWTAKGFAGAEQARRSICAQIEDLRAGTGSAEELREMYRSFGGYARTPAFGHEASAAHGFATPAGRRAETDCLTLEPRGRRA
ncbi:hypothetical protein [Belnapia sp. F-4-1]|uniref:hypothetical protein n=1 Tax=Belnapia sp. F-4-1 TaxID=1545443 RepID=UPI0005B85CB0|nr:hypothetical protein [Belnapia sp. F-4-1]